MTYAINNSHTELSFARVYKSQMETMYQRKKQLSKAYIGTGL
jgi:hypothetical protein